MKLLRKLLILSILSFTMLFSYFLIVTKGLGAAYEDSYQSVLQRKYNLLLETNEPKIILIGGSNLAFGIDSNIISDRTGYKVVNMGLHAGFGQRFNTEISKGNIKKGDIVVLANEFSWMDEGGFDTFGADLIISGIDNRLDIYKHIPISNYVDVLDGLQKYTIDKLVLMDHPEIRTSGVYSSSAFDEYGNMTFQRTGTPITENAKISMTMKHNIISEKSAKYVREFKKYVEGKEAHLYFTSPVFLDEMMIDEENLLVDFPRYVEEVTGVKYISNPKDYLFEEEYMYDAVYHCNSLGAERRSELLSNDILHVIKSNN